MKYCENCGAELEDNQLYCPECGIKQEETTEGRYCEECGAPLEKGDTFCTNCGHAYDDNISMTPKSPRKSKKWAVIIIVSLTVIALAVGAYFIFFNNDGKGTSQNNVDFSVSSPETTQSTAPVETPEPTPVETEKVTPSPSPVLQLNNYTGFWHMNGSLERELSISANGENSVIFTLWYYRLASIEDVSATVVGNTAKFSISDEYYDGEGTLVFNEDSSTVNILESSLTYMPPEQMVFDTRHEQSWQYSGYEDNWGNGSFNQQSPNYQVDILYSKILPYADILLYSDSEIMSNIQPWINSGYTTAEALRLARNEIFANHGNIFEDESLNNYFYTQRSYLYGYGYQNSDEVYKEFNQNEVANIDTIKQLEKQYS